MSKHLVGSRAFFSGMEGFHSKDHDFLILVDQPKGFTWRREQSMRGVCTFEYKKDTPAAMVAKTIEKGDAMLIGKFLVPEVAQAIGATIEDIKPLEVLLPKLDDKHKYEESIFNAYISNGDFTLTDEQRKRAFSIYQEARKKDNEKEPMKHK